MGIDFCIAYHCPWCAIGVNALECGLERVRITAVPTMIIDNRYAHSGGQPVEKVLRGGV